MSKFIAFENLVCANTDTVRCTDTSVYLYVALQRIYVWQNSLFGFISDNKIGRQSFFILFIAIGMEKGIERECVRASGGRNTEPKSVAISTIQKMWILHQFASVNRSGFSWLWMVSSEAPSPNIYTTLAPVIPHFSFAFRSVPLLLPLFLPFNNSFFISSASLHVTTIENNKYLPNSLSFHQFHLDSCVLVCAPHLLHSPSHILLAIPLSTLFTAMMIFA